MFCVRDDNGEEVQDSNCNEDEKPSHNQRCNTQPCPARLVYFCEAGREQAEERKVEGSASVNSP